MNKTKRILSIIMILIIITALTACSSKKEKEPVIKEGVVAIVNNKEITQKQYDEKLSSYKKMVESQYGEGSWDAEISQGMTMGDYYEADLLDNMILEFLILEAAGKAGIKLTQEEINAEFDNFKLYFQTEDEYKKFLSDNAMTEEFLKNALRDEKIINTYFEKTIMSLQPTDDELKKIFDENKTNIKVRASHILVGTEEEAKTVINRINKGESFEAVAKEVSTDTGSGVNGGDLDYFSYIDMVKPFSDAAFAMNVGDLSSPVKSDFGYHVIKVTDKIEDKEVTINSERIKLTQIYQTKKYDELLESIKTNAKIVKKEK